MGKVTFRGGGCLGAGIGPLTAVAAPLQRPCIGKHRRCAAPYTSCTHRSASSTGSGIGWHSSYGTPVQRVHADGPMTGAVGLMVEQS